MVEKKERARERKRVREIRLNERLRKFSKTDLSILIKFNAI